MRPDGSALTRSSHRSRSSRAAATSFGSFLTFGFFTRAGFGGFSTAGSGRSFAGGGPNRAPRRVGGISVGVFCGLGNVPTAGALGFSGSALGTSGSSIGISLFQCTLGGIGSTSRSSRIIPASVLLGNQYGVSQSPCNERPTTNHLLPLASRRRSPRQEAPQAARTSAAGVVQSLLIVKEQAVSISNDDQLFDPLRCLCGSTPIIAHSSRKADSRSACSVVLKRTTSGRSSRSNGSIALPCR